MDQIEELDEIVLSDVNTGHQKNQSMYLKRGPASFINPQGKSLEELSKLPPTQSSPQTDEATPKEDEEIKVGSFSKIGGQSNEEHSVLLQVPVPSAKKRLLDLINTQKNLREIDQDGDDSLMFNDDEVQDIKSQKSIVTLNSSSKRAPK